MLTVAPSFLSLLSRISLLVCLSCLRLLVCPFVNLCLYGLRVPSRMVPKSRRRLTPRSRPSLPPWPAHRPNPVRTSVVLLADVPHLVHLASVILSDAKTLQVFEVTSRYVDL